MDSLNLTDASKLEKDSNYTKIVHKRRSSIFHTHVIPSDECKGTSFTENEKSTGTQDAAECAHTTAEEPFNLDKYIINLKNERKEWIETLKQRKAQRKILTKQKLCIENQGQVIDLNVLTESERAFVMARPNFQEICKNHKKILDVTLKVSELRSIVHKLNEKFILQMEERLQKLTDKIIEISE